MKKKFVLKFALFLALGIALITFLVVLPASPSEKISYYYGINQKDSLVKNTPDPRIVLVGGSNLAFGINSQLLKDSLGLNPVNLGLHGDIGLEYMLQSSIDGIRKNDIVVVAPEYEQFYGDRAYGDGVLLRVIKCEKKDNLNKLSKEQWMRLLHFIPNYATSVFSIGSYFPSRENLGVYSADTFNKYGDVKFHDSKVKVSPLDSIKDSFNEDVLNKLVSYKDAVEKKGACLYIAFPGLQQKSFDLYTKVINEDVQKMRGKGLVILGKPENYAFPDSLLYDVPYHLSQRGADLRTEYLIADLRVELNKKKGISK